MKNAIGLIKSEISETLRINLGHDPLDAASLEKTDAILMQFYKENLYKAEGG